MKKKSQSSIFAAILILVIALTLIIYIVSIPPEDRDSLLGRPSVSNGAPGLIVGEHDFSFKGPGLVDIASSGEKTHRLPSINLRTRINNEFLLESASFIVSRNFKDDNRKVLAFYVEDIDNVDNVYLSFLAPKRSGVLTITLNDNVIFEGELSKTSFSPLRIHRNMLMKNNILTFSVSGVGIQFWRKNEYVIEDFKIFADVMQRSEQSSYVTFQIPESDYDNLDGATLSFYPSCNQGSVGRLIIKLNRAVIYDQIPDCNILNRYDLPKNVLIESTNSLEFSTLKDTYLIDRIEIQTKVRDRSDLIYYFELSEDLFSSTTKPKAVCGEIDGICPSGCSPFLDKDCCFLEYSGRGFWCMVPTSNVHQRCVGRVDNFNFLDCPSGYEDSQGRPPEDFKGHCGDNTDGKCPVGCSIFYDKDCCLEQNMFWCSDLAVTGLTGVCVSTVTNDECKFCPSGYVGKNYNPSCDPISRSPLKYESTLKPEYSSRLILRFVDDGERKVGVIRINGFETSFNTNDGEVEKIIDRFVVEGNNYIQIIPESKFNLVNMRVRVIR